MSNLTAFKALLLLYMPSVFSSQAKLKAVKVKKYYIKGNLICWEVLSVSRAWRKLFQKRGFSPLSKALALYMLLDEAKVRFFVLWQK